MHMLDRSTDEIASGEPIVKHPLNEFTSKFKSKYEVYQLMYIDVGAYLPTSDCVTIYFLKDLAMGKKKCKSLNLL